MVTLDLDANDCKNVAELIELYLPMACRDYYEAGEFDNIDYMRSMLNAYDELSKAARGDEL